MPPHSSLRTRTALVHARVDHNAVPPLGLLGMATVLHDQAWPCRVWDPLPGNTEFFREIVDFKPDVIGVSFLTACFRRARQILSHLHEALPDALLVIGGPHTSALPKASLLSLGAHVAVAGEGEELLLSMIERLEEGRDLEGIPGLYLLKEGEVIGQGTAPPIEDLDRLPIVERELCVSPMSWYLAAPGVLRGLYRRGTTTIIASRGCPHRCVFCASHAIGGRRPRRRSVEHVLEEVQQLIRRYALKGLWFLDDDLALDPEWLARLCAGLGPLGLEWSAQARLDRLDAPLLREMASSGCVQVELGLESGSDRILAELRKGVTAREVEERVQKVRAAGIRVMANFLIGAPGETAADRESTLALARRIRPDFVEFNVCMPYPGSDLYEKAISEGLLSRDARDFDEQWSEHFTRAPILDVGIDGAELLRERTRAQNHHLLKNYLPIARGLLSSPADWPPLARALRNVIMQDPARLRATLRDRQIDPLLWEIYACWSAEMRRRS